MKADHAGSPRHSQADTIQGWPNPFCLGRLAGRIRVTPGPVAVRLAVTTERTRGAGAEVRLESSGPPARFGNRSSIPPLNATCDGSVPGSVQQGLFLEEAGALLVCPPRGRPGSVPNCPARLLGEHAVGPCRSARGTRAGGPDTRRDAGRSFPADRARRAPLRTPGRGPLPSPPASRAIIPT